MFKQRKWNWSKEPTLKCIRKTKWISYKDTDYDRNRPHEIRKPEISTFSTNVALLLQAIVCADICCPMYDDDLNCYGVNAVDDVNVCEFKIFEGSDEIKNLEAYVGHEMASEDSSSEEEEEDYVRPAKMRKTCTQLYLTSPDRSVIQLAKPIVITPGLNYTISLKLDDRNVDGQLSTDVVLKDTEVNVQNGITIEFSNDAKLDGFKGNLIYGLHFSKV